MKTGTIILVWGTIPLNNMFENVDQDSIPTEHARTLRNVLGFKWKHLNLVRTIASGTTFLLLVIALGKNEH